MIATRQCKDAEQVIQQAAIQLNTLFYSLKDKPVLFLSSGGSALKVLPLINISNITGTVTISMLDERFSDEVGENNFSQLMAMPFYTGAQSAGAMFIDPRKQSGDTLASAAERWNAQIHEWVVKNPQGQIIATVGLGKDGHIAGIMPYPEAGTIFESLFCQREPWIVGYQATGKNPFPDRMTTTISFLKDTITNAVAVIAGADKKIALDKVLAEKGTISETPGRVMKEMKNVLLLTDIL